VSTQQSFLDELAAEVSGLRRASTAERVAEILRRRVTEGDLPPGSQLSEEQLSAVLQVSRNTLREAFRLLGHEGLLVHRLHRGVFVTELSDDELADVYRVRRAIECDVVRRLGGTAPDPEVLEPLRADVADGAAAAARGDWTGVGTANMHFHSHLVALAGSPRLDAATSRLLAELRLAFQGADAEAMHAPYVERNGALLDLVAAGRTAEAAAALEDYLDVSLAHLTDLRRDHEEQP
jgi:DNA-binding GntR family transcriptional regulator